MNQDKEKALFDNADKFIDLANEMSKTVNTGDIGMALRYAAARYSAFEASLQSKNLAEDKDRAMEFFTKTFKEMLQNNIEQYIRIQANQNKE